MPNIPVFVVTLKRAVERRQRMLSHIDSLGINPRVIDAVDGRLLSAEECTKLVAPGVQIHAGAIGCYLSHLQIYEQMVAERIPLALVLEDDARLNPEFVKILASGSKSLGFDYCFLDSDDHNDKVDIYYDPDDAVEISGAVRANRLSAGPQTTHAYMITLAGAEKRLSAAFPIQKSIDLYDHLPYPIEFRAIVTPKMAWVSEDSLESFTSDRSVAADSLSLSWLRKSFLFYRLRDALKLKGIKRRLKVQAMVKAGLLKAGIRWKPLPSGREVVL